MGRQTRQARRAQERRAHQTGRKQPQESISKWAIFGGVSVVLAAVALFAIFAFTQNTGNSNATPTVGPAVAVGPAHCDQSGERVSYHKHAHLEIYDAGKPVTVPALIGFNVDHDCLYWVHTHQPSYGVIHIEAPYKILPTLGDFFKIWGAPLNSTQVGTTKVQPGQSIKVFVNEKPFYGDPNTIVLHAHTNVTIDIGPPFPKPKPFAYGTL